MAEEGPSLPGYIRRWWQALVQPETAGRLILGRERLPGFDLFLALAIAALYAVYGVTMGLFRGAYPAAVSGLKMPFLYLLTLVICFPPFYVLNCQLGPRLRAGECARLLLVAVGANAIAVASYSPFSLFFTLTTSKQGYLFLVLMHVAAFGLSAIASLVAVAFIFRATAQEKGHRLHPAFILGWGLLYAFVGTQLAWTLRPWIGAWNVPYHPFRPIGGSFLEAVWKAMLWFAGR